MSSSLLSAWPNTAIDDLVMAVEAETKEYLPSALRNYKEGLGTAHDFVACVKEGAETLLRFIEDAEGEIADA